MILLYKYILNDDKKVYNESKGLYYLRDAVSRAFPDENILIFKDNKGKPISDKSGFFVSVSHTGNIVICAVSDALIGIDAESFRDKINVKRIAERFFTENEILKMESDGDRTFYEIWCRKEAYSKAEGSGLSYGIKKIETVLKDDINGKTFFLDEINGIRITGHRIKEGYFACAGGRGEITWTEVQE